MCSVLREEFCSDMVVIRFVFSRADLLHLYLQFPIFIRVENGILSFILYTDVIWQFHYIAS